MSGEFLKDEVPIEYRLYIKPEDLGKLPKGVKVYQGKRGGIYVDRRELKAVGGIKEQGEQVVRTPVDFVLTDELYEGLEREFGYDPMFDDYFEDWHISDEEFLQEDFIEYQVGAPVIRAKEYVDRIRERLVKAGFDDDTALALAKGNYVFRIWASRYFRDVSGHIETLVQKIRGNGRQKRKADPEMIDELPGLRYIMTKVTEKDLLMWKKFSEEMFKRKYGDKAVVYRGLSRLESVSAIRQIIDGKSHDEVVLYGTLLSWTDHDFVASGGEFADFGIVVRTEITPDMVWSGWWGVSELHFDEREIIVEVPKEGIKTYIHSTDKEKYDFDLLDKLVRGELEIDESSSFRRWSLQGRVRRLVNNVKWSVFDCVVNEYYYNDFKYVMLRLSELYYNAMVKFDMFDRGVFEGYFYVYSGYFDKLKDSDLSGYEPEEIERLKDFSVMWFKLWKDYVERARKERLIEDEEYERQYKLIADAESILKEKFGDVGKGMEFVKDDVPVQYRLYIKPEDINKLPKGVKVYRGRRGGLYIDRRELSAVRGRIEEHEPKRTRERGIDLTDEMYERLKRHRGIVSEKKSAFRDIEGDIVENNLYWTLDRKDLDFRKDPEGYVNEVKEILKEIGYDDESARAIAKGMIVFRLWTSGDFDRYGGCAEELIQEVRGNDRLRRECEGKDIEVLRYIRENVIEKDLQMWKEFSEEVFRKEYGNEVKVFRGISNIELVQIFKAIADGYSLDEITIKGTLSSWSYDIAIADEFGRRSSGVIVEVEATPELVWGGWWNASTDYLREKELILEMPKDGLNVRIADSIYFDFDTLAKIFAEGIESDDDLREIGLIYKNLVVDVDEFEKIAGIWEIYRDFETFCSELDDRLYEYAEQNAMNGNMATAADAISFYVKVLRVLLERLETGALEGDVEERTKSFCIAIYQWADRYRHMLLDFGLVEDREEMEHIDSLTGFSEVKSRLKAITSGGGR